MTLFGWFSVVLWALLAVGVARGDNPWYMSILPLFMLVGTLAWGTGSL